jgi:putative MATE family efflux protein
MNKKLSVTGLAWPIFIEIALFMVMGNIDVIMLSRYSQNAVAAVGNANQILALTGLVFSVITAATGILFSQNLGARNHDQLNVIASTSLFGNLLFSLIISIFILLFSETLLILINVPSDLIPIALEYMQIVGGLIFIFSLSMTLTSIIKSSGNTKPVMSMALLMNVLNVIGNYIFLFGPFGLPILGVQGVAISTAFARTVAFVFYFIYVKKVLNVHISLKHLLPFPKELVKKMLHIGIPSALEPLSYQLSQVVIFSIINTLGIWVINTRMYVQTMVMFVYLAVLAISQASQIIVGHMVGANQEDDVKKVVYKNLRISLVITLTMSILLAIFNRTIITIFTDDIRIIELAAIIFIIDIFVEIGRVFNLVLISSAKGAGDVRYPAYIGIASMWIVCVGLSFVLVRFVGLGLVGIWIALASDEAIRSVLMLRRWQSDRWKGRKFV